MAFRADVVPSFYHYNGLQNSHQNYQTQAKSDKKIYCQCEVGLKTYPNVGME